MTRLFTLFTAAAVILLVMAWCIPPAHSQEPLPEWVTIVPAQDCSQGCWRVVDAYYLDEVPSNGLHHAFGRTRNAEGAYIVAPFGLGWSNGQAMANTKAPPDWGDHALWDCFAANEGEVGGYRVWAGQWEANSDTVEGLGLPYCVHVSYYVVWQWVNPDTSPTPTPTPTVPPPLPIRLYLPVVGKG